MGGTRLVSCHPQLKTSATLPLRSHMVSADNLNHDVLELIFAYISTHDLTSVSLVSRSFLAGAIPTLYRTIIYRLREAKAYDSVRICLGTVV